MSKVGKQARRCTAEAIVHHSFLEHRLQSRQGGPAEQEVREEDQQRINTFNKLNTRLHELQAGVKAKKVVVISAWSEVQQTKGCMLVNMVCRANTDTC